MINVRDRDSIQSARPFRVAHRGGVITPESPENSMRAIELAAAHGYAMVELDVMEAADAEPVLIHDGLYINCGVNKKVHALTSREIMDIRYRASDQHVITLEQAIEACARLRLGVMLDRLCKDSSEDPAMSSKCLSRVVSLIRDAGLAQATVTIVDWSGLRETLSEIALFPVRREVYEQILGGCDVSLDDQFWFGWAAELPDHALPRIHRNGAFAIVSINTFHYPHHAPIALARQDVARLLAAGTNGFQIDNVFEEFFRD